MKNTVDTLICHRLSVVRENWKVSSDFNMGRYNNIMQFEYNSEFRSKKHLHTTVPPVTLSYYKFHLQYIKLHLPTYKSVLFVDQSEPTGHHHFLLLTIISGFHHFSQFLFQHGSLFVNLFLLPFQCFQLIMYIIVMLKESN